MLNLKQDEYSNQSAVFPTAKTDNENALKDYLMYRIIYDLRRGWRVMLPNLEQSGLLKISFRHFEENTAIDSIWQSLPLFDCIAIEKRRQVIQQVLDFIRRSEAIFSNEYLTKEAIELKRKNINEKLKNPWKFEPNEKIPAPNFIRYDTLQNFSNIFSISVGSKSALGKYFKALSKEIYGVQWNQETYQDFIERFLDTLADAGWLICNKNFSNKDGKPTKVYQLRLDSIIWELGDEKSVATDKVRIRTYKDFEETPNLFFAVLHYDLPWNPNRLEQRECRVDRFGQSADIVKAYMLYGADNPIDGIVLQVLLRKVREIRKSIWIKCLKTSIIPTLP